MDFPKEMSLAELTKQIASFFLPNGVSFIQQVNVADLDIYIATFTGEQLRDKLDNGDDFSVRGYCAQVAVNPLRVYLYTSLKPDTASEPPSDVDRWEINDTASDPSSDYEDRQELSIDDNLPILAEYGHQRRRADHININTNARYPRSRLQIRRSEW